MIPLWLFFFCTPTPFFLTEIVPKLPTCVKTEVFSGREHGLGTQGSMSLSPVAWRRARHATQTLNLLPQQISPNPEPPPQLFPKLPPSPSLPSTLFNQIFFLLRVLTCVLLIADRQLYANANTQARKRWPRLINNLCETAVNKYLFKVC